MFKNIKNILFPKHEIKELEPIELKLVSEQTKYKECTLPMPDYGFDSFSFQKALTDFKFQYKKFITVEDNSLAVGILQCDLAINALRVAIIDEETFNKIKNPVLMLDVITIPGNPKYIVEIKDIRVTSYDTLPKVKQLLFKGRFNKEVE